VGAAFARTVFAGTAVFFAAAALAGALAGAGFFAAPFAALTFVAVLAATVVLAIGTSFVKQAKQYISFGPHAEGRGSARIVPRAADVIVPGLHDRVAMMIASCISASCAVRSWGPSGEGSHRACAGSGRVVAAGSSWSSRAMASSPVPSASARRTRGRATVAEGPRP